MVDKTAVFKGERAFYAPDVKVPFKLNTCLEMDGLEMLKALPSDSFSLVFFDPQYGSVMDRLKYGNTLQQNRMAQAPMSGDVIQQFIDEIERILIPRGHLMLWCDKYLLFTGDLNKWVSDNQLNLVDMITWNKMRMGLGYRSRRASEHLVVYQKTPTRVKGVWMSRKIPDTWNELKPRGGHTHAKPIGLQKAIIEAVTNVGDIVIDPSAGGFGVMDAAVSVGRRFLGCDLDPVYKHNLVLTTKG